MYNKHCIWRSVALNIKLLALTVGDPKRSTTVLNYFKEEAGFQLALEKSNGHLTSFFL